MQPATVESIFTHWFRNAQMFFLFGSPRSGTTILAQCISAHPDIVIPDETDILVPLSMIAQRVPDAALGRSLISDLIAGSDRFPFGIGEYLSADEVRECVGSAEYAPAPIIAALYDRIAAASGKAIAGDKSPNDLLSLRELHAARAIDEATPVIHIVRDVRDVMLSLGKTGWAPKDIDHYFPRLWSDRNLYLRHLGQSLRRYLLIRYEDFVTEPAAVLERVCGMLGVEYTASMLDKNLRHQRYRGVTHHMNIYSDISSASVGKYQSAIPKKKITDYEQQAKEALIAFGYMKPSRWRLLG